VIVQDHNGTEENSILEGLDGQPRAPTLQQGSTGEAVATIHGGIGWVASAAFSQGGRWLALGGENGTVKVYQTAGAGLSQQLQEVRTLEAHPSVVHYLALTPDGRRLATTSEDRTLIVWDVTTGHEALLLDIHTGKITSLAFSADGHRLASGSADKTVKISDGTPWEDSEHSGPSVLKPRFTWTAHRHKVAAVAFSPDSQRLISAGWDKTVKIWDVRSGQEMLSVPGLPAWLTGVAFSQGGQCFAVASLDGTVTVCDAYRGAKVCTLRGEGGPVHGVAFNPVSNRLASAHHDGSIKFWDIERGRAEEGRPLISFPAHTDAVFGVTYSPDGRLLATAGGRDPEQNVGIWEPATGKAIRPFQVPNFVRSVAFSPDARRLACAPGHWVTLLDVKSRQELHKTPHGDRVFSMVFSPDGRRLATAGEGQVAWLWDASGGQELKDPVQLRVAGGELWDVAFSRDGRYLATCSGYKGKGTIQIWDAIGIGH
jgi:WD40 repeat protein